MNVPPEMVHFLRTSDDFFIATHIDPEGDALGSSLALSLALGAMGKRSRVFNRDAVPVIYRYLPSSESVTDQAPAYVDRLLLLDCNSLKRAALEKTEIGVAAVIDHHSTGNDYGDIRWIVPDAPATGLMVYTLIKELGVPISRDMAVNLYTAIGIDTGIFRFSNTTAECLFAAAELVTLGAVPSYIADRLYNNYSKGRFLLLKKVIETLELHGTIAISAITEAMFRESGTSAEDTENFVNFALQMDEIQVAALIRQVDQVDALTWKVSLRSKEGADVSQVAVHFGGGGHRNASGCTIKGELADIKKKILDKLSQIIS
ncbi:MAG: DHH family phosphoesterase [bacterium]